MDESIKVRIKIWLPSPSFGSIGDEESFFRWINAISGVDEVVGERDGVEIYVYPDRLDDETLKEIAALVGRYMVEVK